MGVEKIDPFFFFLSLFLIFSMLPVSLGVLPFFPETAWSWHGPSAPSSLKEMAQPPATVRSSPEPFHSSGSGSSLFMTIWLLCHPCTMTDIILFWCMTGAGKRRRRAMQQAGDVDAL